MANNQSYPQAVYPLAGDVQSVVGNQTVTVTGLQTVPVDTTAPASGQFLGFNGSIWTPTAAPTGPSFGTAGLGYFIGAGVMDFVSVTDAVTANFLVTTNNAVLVHQFVLESTWTISNVSFQFSGGTSVGEKANFGIYDHTGAKLIDASLDASITTLQTVSFTPVTLTPAVYYFAQADSIGGGAKGPMSNPSGNSDATQLLASIGAVTPLIAIATNSLSGTTLPATLGALTAVTTGNYTGMGLAVWKP